MTTTIPTNRIVGDATPAQVLLLERLDNLLDDCLYARRPHFAGWDVQVVLCGTGVRRRNGVTVALRATPRAGLTLEQAGTFPWQHLGAIAAHIRSQVWEVTAVVPDVATTPPHLDAHPLVYGGWDERLTA